MAPPPPKKRHFTGDGKAVTVDAGLYLRNSSVSLTAADSVEGGFTGSTGVKRQTQPCLISVCSSGSLDKLNSACPLLFWPACFPSLLSCRLSAVALRRLHGGAPPCLLALSPEGFGFAASKQVRAQSPRRRPRTFVALYVR